MPDVRIRVICSACRRELEASNTDPREFRGGLREMQVGIEVPLCPDCLAEAREEARGA